MVEIAPARELYDKPRHPYTEALLSAVPIPDPKVKRKRIVLKGDVPSPIRPPPGCHFHPRCPIAVERCSPEGDSALEEEQTRAIRGVPFRRTRPRATPPPPP